VKQIKVSDFVYEKIAQVKERNGHTSLDSALREFIYGYTGHDKWKQYALAKARDGHDCLMCGMSESDHLDEYGRALSVHHIEHRHTVDGAGNELSNLATLCTACHTKIELNDGEESDLIAELPEWRK